MTFERYDQCRESRPICLVALFLKSGTSSFREIDRRRCDSAGVVVLSPKSLRPSGIAVAPATGERREFVQYRSVGSKL